jgi:hypothetical protein
MGSIYSIFYPELLPAENPEGILAHLKYNLSGGKLFKLFPEIINISRSVQYRDHLTFIIYAFSEVIILGLIKSETADCANRSLNKGNINDRCRVLGQASDITTLSGAINFLEDDNNVSHKEVAIAFWYVIKYKGAISEDIITLFLNRLEPWFKVTMVMVITNLECLMKHRPLVNGMTESKLELEYPLCLAVINLIHIISTSTGDELANNMNIFRGTHSPCSANDLARIYICHPETPEGKIKEIAKYYNCKYNTFKFVSMRRKACLLDTNDPDDLKIVEDTMQSAKREWESCYQKAFPNIPYLCRHGM